MLIAHLLASPFYGGPERQVLGLAQHLPRSCSSAFLSFRERGLADDFLRRADSLGFEAIGLTHNWPHLPGCVREISSQLRRLRADVVCTHGYKPDLLGWLASRRSGLPVMAVAHGWTGASFKVRLNESLDRRVLRRMDRVVCVSAAEAHRVTAAGVLPDRVAVIENGIDSAASAPRTAADRLTLEQLFSQPPRTVVAAAGRLSPEKGFDLLIEAAAELVRDHVGLGFVLFGDGPLRDSLQQLIDARGLRARFVLAGFRDDLRRLLPQADLLVLSSRTEGLPVILLEALAAGLPVVATAVGGVPEVIEDGASGLLVKPDSADQLAIAIERLLADDALRSRLAAAGRQRVVDRHCVRRQAAKYQQLFEELGTR